MPSTPYSTELQPEPRWRDTVLLSGVAATLLGLLVIAVMDIGLRWRVIAGIVWLARAAWELCDITLGYKRFHRLRIHEQGGVELCDTSGTWCTATLLGGSVVLRRVAWLRLAPDRGRPYPELLRCPDGESEAWRRFRVIWRHMGAGP